MSFWRRQNTWKVLIAFAIVFGLLLSLAHVGASSGHALALVVFTADALFAAVDIPRTLWTVSESAVLLPQAPAADFMFQRPPPTLA